MAYQMTYDDLKMRVFNSASGRIITLNKKPSLWRHGDLLLIGNEKGVVEAVFGDGSMEISVIQIAELAGMISKRWRT